MKTSQGKIVAKFLSRAFPTAPFPDIMGLIEEQVLWSMLPCVFCYSDVLGCIDVCIQDRMLMLLSCRWIQELSATASSVTSVFRLIRSRATFFSLC